MNAKVIAMHLLRFKVKDAPRFITVKQLDALANHIDLILYQHELMGEKIGLNDLSNLHVDLNEIKKILEEAK